MKEDNQKANKHIKRCSTELVRKMKSKSHETLLHTQQNGQNEEAMPSLSPETDVD